MEGGHVASCALRGGKLLMRPAERNQESFPNMVNLFRKHQQTVMILITLMTIVTFVGFYSKSNLVDHGNSGRVAVIYGRNVTLGEAQKIGRKADLAQQMGGMGDRSMAELHQFLAIRRQDAKENYIWNSMVLQHEASALGVEPTEDEIFEAVQSNPIFQSNGKYNSATFAIMSQMLLAPKGFTTEDFTAMVADSLRLKKVKELLGCSTAPAESEIRDAFAQFFQKVEASVIRFKLDDFLASTQVPEEDVKKLYEDKKASLKTDEQRKLQFVAFVLPKTDKPLQGRERGDKLTQLQKEAEDFAVALTEKGAKFDAVAAAQKLKPEESPLFPMNNPPEALGSSHEVAQAAFKLNEQEPNSEVIETRNGYYVLHLAAVKQPQQLTFDEAKAQLTDSLKHERAQESLNLKASDVRNKIDADLKAGKSLAEAAQALGVKAEAVPPFSSQEMPAGVADGPEIVQSSADLVDGQLSTALPSADGSIIVYKKDRLPIDEKEFETQKPKLVERQMEIQSASLFQEWLKLRRAAAQLKTEFRS